ncbi:hypothetical protein PybrP1_013137 [[Pythium] brassicae (nom. inval.)]|nr:hypothetical protein PybrP1_013137 [[Pythium] brassicae (nom. inval.)]
MSTYALQGMGYFVTHPRLWATSLCPMLLSVVVAAVSTIGLFAIGLYPQAELLEEAGVPTGLSWLVAVIMVVVEIFLVTLIYSLAVVGCFMDKVFEQVLHHRGHGALVENEKNHASCCRTCGACCRVSLWLRIVVLIVTLPLNLIPIVGTLAWIWLNGTILAWEYHLYYFELKNLKYAQQKEFVAAHKAQYSAFGMQAMFIEMIPFFGTLFLFTNAVGAALFAADLEDEMASGAGAGAGVIGASAPLTGPKSSVPAHIP